MADNGEELWEPYGQNLYSDINNKPRKRNISEYLTSNTTKIFCNAAGEISSSCFYLFFVFIVILYIPQFLAVNFSSKREYLGFSFTSC